jgi:hypothetical protein
MPGLHSKTLRSNLIDIINAGGDYYRYPITACLFFSACHRPAVLTLWCVANAELARFLQFLTIFLMPKHCCRFAKSPSRAFCIKFRLLPPDSAPGGSEYRI